MATVYADANGVIVRVIRSDADGAFYPDPPSSNARVLDFDAATNSVLLHVLLDDWSLYRINGSGALTLNGTPVVIAPDGAEQTFARIQKQAAAALRAVDWNAKITTAQAGQALVDDMTRLLGLAAPVFTDLTAKITAVNAAANFAAIKPPLVAALNDISALLSGIQSILTDAKQFSLGTKNELVDEEKRWRAVLQAVALTNDTTPPDVS